MNEKIKQNEDDELTMEWEKAKKKLREIYDSLSPERRKNFTLTILNLIDEFKKE